MEKKRRLPIFLEFSIISTIIIVAIIGIYSLVQIVSMGMLSIDYEKEQIENRYEELKYILANVNLQEDILEGIVANDDEAMRIYQKDKITYMVNDDIWSEIPLSDNNKMQKKCKFMHWEMYILLNGQIEIDNETYNIQIIREDTIFDEIIENYLKTLIISLVIGIVLSITGAIYLSKRFVGRLKNLSKTINEVKEHGIKHRVAISETNDEFDKVNALFNEMMDEVEEAFNEQVRFVSDASHELRTPLTALQGHLRMIKRWGKNDKERLEKSLDICIDETERLTKIVGDLLSLSRVENQTINRLEIAPLEIEPIVKQVTEHYKILSEKVHFAIKIEPGVKIRMQKDHLKQLMIIFIDNAIKYNDKEECNISIEIYEKNDNIHFSLEDNGKGIPKEELPYIRQRFYKVDKSRKNNNSFGLGLSIADKIISLYHGKIKIDSEMHKYTRIIFVIEK